MNLIAFLPLAAGEAIIPLSRLCAAMERRFTLPTTSIAVALTGPSMTSEGERVRSFFGPARLARHCEPIPEEISRLTLRRMLNE